jgi:hypothetical protein
LTGLQVCEAADVSSVLQLLKTIGVGIKWAPSRSTHTAGMEVGKMEIGEENGVLVPQRSDTADSAAFTPAQRPERQAGRIEFATRLVVGLLSSGSGELWRRLDELQEEVLTDPGVVPGDAVAQSTSNRDALRYLTIALLLRGQRRITNTVRDGARSGLALSKGAVRWTVRTLDRLTDNPLGRPVRRPIARRARQWEQQLAQLIQEGEIEEETSKVLASESVGLIIDQVVDMIAENPELDRMIADLVSQKGVGYATVMADNTRTLAAVADDVTDALLRKLLRRKPLRELPPSILAGKPQTMYRAEAPAEEVEQDDR